MHAVGPLVCRLAGPGEHGEEGRVRLGYPQVRSAVDVRDAPADRPCDVSLWWENLENTNYSAKEKRMSTPRENERQPPEKTNARIVSRVFFAPVKLRGAPALLSPRHGVAWRGK